LLHLLIHHENPKFKSLSGPFWSKLLLNFYNIIFLCWKFWKESYKKKSVRRVLFVSFVLVRLSFSHTKWVKTFVNFSIFSFSEKCSESNKSCGKQTFHMQMGQNTLEKFSESSYSLRNFKNLIMKLSQSFLILNRNFNALLMIAYFKKKPD